MLMPMNELASFRLHFGAIGLLGPDSLDVAVLLSLVRIPSTLISLLKLI